MKEINVNEIKLVSGATKSVSEIIFSTLDIGLTNPNGCCPKSEEDGFKLPRPMGPITLDPNITIIVHHIP